MHFTLVTDEYCAPSRTTRGTAINTWSIASALLQNGHAVTTMIVTDKEAGFFNHLQAAGINVKTIPFGDYQPYAPTERLKLAMIRPRMQTFYPWVALAGSMEAALEKVGPDAVLAYNIYNLAATHGINKYPRMCVFCDLDQMVAHYRWLDHPRRPLRPYLRATLRRMVHWHQWRFMKELLSGCQSVVNYASHHTNWLHSHGMPDVVYVPPPTIERRPKEDSLSTSRSRAGPPRVLMVGHLGGIATISGAKSFLSELLPRMKQRLGAGNFEVHVVGETSRNIWLTNELNKEPSIKVRGYVEDVEAEFLAADVVLVPTPIKLGTRTRIIEGFSYGSCIVAHRANALGIPQLIDGKNGLLADDGESFANAIARALTDAKLRDSLRAEARRTYEEVFSLEVAGAKLVAELESIARPAASN